MGEVIQHAPTDQARRSDDGGSTDGRGRRDGVRRRRRIRPPLDESTAGVWPRIDQAFAAAHRQAAKGLY